MKTRLTIDSRGRLSAYALACGYIEQRGNVKLWHEHGCYHVRLWVRETGQRDWRSMRTLTEARKTMSLLARAA